MGYKKYKVNVEGKEYTVEVEELTGYSDRERSSSREAGSSASSAPVREQVVEKKPEAASAARAEEPVFEGDTIVKAPLQGVIIGVAVKEGQTVKAGDLLLKIEALKMENEILSPCGGTIKSVKVSDGNRVGSGDVLCVIG